MELTARDIMSETVVACLPETRVEDVVKKLAESEISGMPVIDQEERVIGIVSESDLLLVDQEEPPRMKTALFGFYVLRESVMDRMAEQRGWRIEDLMTKDVVTFRPEDSVKKIAKAMHDQDINRVPIVNEKGVLVGIITRGDIIRAMAHHM